MIGEFNLYGIYFPWLLVLGVVTLGVAWALRRVLARVGLYRLVWHPALFDLGLYVMLLFAVQRTFPSLLKLLMV